MRIPRPLAEALLSQNTAEQIRRFCLDNQWLLAEDSLDNVRFLNRSVVPHVKKLSGLFNRREKNSNPGLSSYWKNSSNPKNLRLAYFLLFHPANAMRVAAVMSELKRLGHPFKGPIKAIDFGTGMGAAPWGWQMALPELVTQWTLIEKDRSALQTAQAWLEQLEISQRSQVQDLDWSQLSKVSRDSFDLAVSSYCLNEVNQDLGELASAVLDFMDRRLNTRGLFVFIEPALKPQSRRLLELRRQILNLLAKDKRIPARVLLPCLGHQACGALANPEDWCHDEAVWWRPKWIQQIDRLAGLDHKTLPFSYLVLQKAKFTDPNPLPQKVWRLVSPAHREGRKLEFYLCGEEGKFRSRLLVPKGEPLSDLGRGDLLQIAEHPRDSDIFELGVKTRKVE